jgi:hypothetical protein
MLVRCESFTVKRLVTEMRLNAREHVQRKEDVIEPPVPKKPQKSP